MHPCSGAHLSTSSSVMGGAPTAASRSRSATSSCTAIERIGAPPPVPRARGARAGSARSVTRPGMTPRARAGATSTGSSALQPRTHPPARPQQHSHRSLALACGPRPPAARSPPGARGLARGGGHGRERGWMQGARGHHRGEGESPPAPEYARTGTRRFPERAAARTAGAAFGDELIVSLIPQPCPSSFVTSPPFPPRIVI